MAGGQNSGGRESPPRWQALVWRYAPLIVAALAFAVTIALVLFGER